MRPVIFDFNLFGWELSLPTYGLLLALGFLAALAVAMSQARRAGMASDAVTDLWIVSLLSGVVGAKLLLYLLDWRYYLANPSSILTTLRSAGVWYGGLILAIAAALIIIRRKGLDGWLLGDVAAPAIAVGQAIGRLGCFAAGCCYGKPCTLPWAVTFTDPRAREITGVPLHTALHPTQIYHSIAGIVLFLFLIFLAKRKRFDGQVLLSYLILYALGRGAIEFFRDDARGSLGGFSTSQILSLAVLVTASILYFRRRRSAPAPSSHNRS